MQQRQIVISPVENAIAAAIDETFAKQVDGFIKKTVPPCKPGEVTVGLAGLTAEQVPPGKGIQE